MLTTLFQRVKELPNYLASQGVWPGAMMWLMMLAVRASRTGALRRINVPSLGRAVTLRNHESDLSILFQVAVKREYGLDDFPQATALRQRYDGIVAAGRTPLIIDAGGNIGFATLYFATCFPRARIVSIEPDETNASILRQNISGLAGAELIVAGLWNRKTNLRIVDPNAGPGGIRVEEDDTGKSGIPTVTIAEILARHSDCEPLVLKVDIEGAEEVVFQSNVDWLGRFPLVAIELHDWLFPGKGTSRSFLRAIADSNFDVVISGENLICFARPAGQRTVGASG